MGLTRTKQSVKRFVRKTPVLRKFTPLAGIRGNARNFRRNLSEKRERVGSLRGGGNIKERARRVGGGLKRIRSPIGSRDNPRTPEKRWVPYHRYTQNPRSESQTVFIDEPDGTTRKVTQSRGKSVRGSIVPSSGGETLSQARARIRENERIRRAEKRRPATKLYDKGASFVTSSDMSRRERASRTTRRVSDNTRFVKVRGKRK